MSTYSSTEQSVTRSKGPLSKPPSVSAKPFLPLPCKKAGKGPKSGLNNAARKTKHPILGAAESLPLLNEEFAKSLFCGGKDSSAPTSNFKLPTSNFQLRTFQLRTFQPFNFSTFQLFNFKLQTSNFQLFTPMERVLKPNPTFDNI